MEYALRDRAVDQLLCFKKLFFRIDPIVGAHRLAKLLYRGANFASHRLIAESPRFALPMPFDA